MRTLQACQKSHYLAIVILLWQEGPEAAHDQYPDISVGKFIIANKYFDTLRCPGCFCGSCVGLVDLASDLENSPKPLQPIASLAMKLAKKEYDDQSH